MSQGMTFWRYGCAVTGGRLLLDLPADEATDADAVALALRLAEAEPLLAALQAWCGQALDPQPWSEAPAAPAGAVFSGALRAPGAVTSEARSTPDATPHAAADTTADPQAAIAAEPATPGLAPAGTRLWCPLAWLAAQPPAPAALLHWPALPLEVELACYGANQLPTDAGAQAGALLLPGAFEARWPVRLCAPPLGLAWPATWGGPGTPLGLAANRPMVDERRWSGHGKSADGPDSVAREAAWRVLLDGPWRLPLPALLGWPAAAESEVGTASPLPPHPAARSGLARLQGPGVDRPGQVVPVLQGAAWVPAAGIEQEVPAWT